MINSILIMTIPSYCHNNILIRRDSLTRTDGILEVNFDYRTATSLARPTDALAYIFVERHLKDSIRLFPPSVVY